MFFFEAARPKISDRLSSDLRELNRGFKFMIYLRVKFYKESNDGTIHGSELWVHNRNQLVLFEPNEIEDALNTAFAQILEVIERLFAEWFCVGS